MNINNDKNQVDFDVPYASRVETILIAAFGCLNIIILAVVLKFTSLDEIVIAVGAVFLFLLEVSLLRFFRVKHARILWRYKIPLNSI